MILYMLAISMAILIAGYGYRLFRIIVAQLKRFSHGRVTQHSNLFLTNFIDCKAFYMYRFNEVPCIAFINDIDTDKASEYIRAAFGNDILAVYQHNQFNHDAGELRFNVTIFVLSNSRMIELGSNYAEILHGNKQYGFAADLAGKLSAFRLEIQLDAQEVFTHVQIAGFRRQHEMN